MNILNRLTIKNLTLNKKRTIVTMIGIMLSVALICAVAGMFTCFHATVLEETIKSRGYYHVKLEDVSSSDINKIKHNKDIAVLNSISEVGYAILEGSTNESKPYLHVYSVSEIDAFKNLSFQLLEGRFPKNENEVVISDHIEKNGEVTYHIGDTLHLEIGHRISDGYILNGSNPYQEDEVLENMVTKDFKIVGIIQRPNYYFEDYIDPGYTIITNQLNSETFDLYLALAHPKDYRKSISELLNIDENKVDKCTDGISCDLAYQYSINRELLRWEVFNFGEDTFRMLITIAGVVIAIIMGTSIFVIRNAFAISTTEKSKMIGMLKSVGATKKQIKKSVIFEGMVLGFIAIPLGILCGILAVYILTIIVNLLVGSFMFGNIDGMVFKISWIPIIISTFLGFVTIYLSCLASSRKASRISPIESIRNNQETFIRKRKLKTPIFVEKLFKTGGVIAYKNLKRSSKKYRTTVVSLVVSIFVFISMNSFINYGFELSGAYYTDYDYNIAINVYKDEDIPKILSLPNIDSYSKIATSPHSVSIYDKEIMTDFAKQYVLTTRCFKLEDEERCTDMEYLSLMIIVLDDASFKKYTNKLGVNYEKVKDSVILNDYYLYHGKDGNTYNRLFTYQVGDKIKDVSESGNKTVHTIGAITKIPPDGNEDTYIDGGFLYMSEEYYYKHFDEPLVGNVIAISSSDANQFEKDFKALKINSYFMNIEEIVKQQKAMLIVVSIFLYGFITVITLIGVTNIFNTITTNMNLRQKEFAMLKSIGMTKKEFNRMINLETLFYCTKALVYGIILGILGSYGIYKAFAVDFDAGYQFPTIAIVICIIFVFLIVYMIMKYSISKINKQNIIETIRNENI